MIFTEPSEAESLSKRGVGQGISELEDLHGRDGGGQFHIPLPQKVQRRLGESVGYDTQFSVFVQRQSLIRILDAVRNAVLEWALKLEEDGVVGEGLTFSEREQGKAQASMQNVTNFFAPVSGASVTNAGRDVITVSVDVDLQDVKALVAAVREGVEQLELPQEAFAEVEAELATLDAQLASPKPKRGIVKESLASLRSILEGAGGGVAGHLILEIGKILAGG